MAVLEIVKYGNPILKKKCSLVSNFDNIENTIDDLFDSMYEAEGIGLAANQVGLNMNLFIIDITHTDEYDKPFIFINSEIISKHGEKKVFQEGCLSLPEIALDVIRPEYVTIKYQTMDGEWFEKEFGGLMSRAIQHEMDHLNGIFVIDRVSGSQKIKFQAKLKSIEKDSKKTMQIQTENKGFVL